jgi:hypothetical protein
MSWESKYIHLHPGGGILEFFLQEAGCVFRVADLLKFEVLLGWQFRVD